MTYYLRRVISLVLIFAIFPIYSYAVDNSEYLTSVYPDLNDGIGYDFSYFESDSSLPVMINSYISGGNVYFDGALCIEASTSGSEAFIYHSNVSSSGTMVIIADIRVPDTARGTNAVYLRDSLSSHPGCEFPLLKFSGSELSFIGQHSAEYAPDIFASYRIELDFIHGRAVLYTNDVLSCKYDNVYELIPSLKNFDYSAFYPRFHVSSADGGLNKMEIKSLSMYSDLSSSHDISAVCRGLYKGNDKIIYPSDGEYDIIWSVSNSSDLDKKIYISSGINDYTSSLHTIPAKSSVELKGAVYISNINIADSIKSRITDESFKYLSHDYTISSIGYNPPTASELMSMDYSGLSHPRIAGNADDFVKAEQLASSDSMISDAYASGYDKTLADKLISRAPNGGYYHVPCSYDDNDDLRLVSADTILRYCKSLAAQYKITKNNDYKKRLWMELQNAGTNFPDWNPKHFLDTASITAAFAISYDWLYDDWSDGEKNFIRNCIIDKGLNEYSKVYSGMADNYGEWRYRRNNWNIVCNGGALLGCMALIDDPDCRELCSNVASGAFNSLGTALQTFYPDGAWYEGVGYWQYSMQFLTLIMSSMEHTFGNLYGIDNVRGLKKSSLFGMYMTGDYSVNLNDSSSLEYISMPECLYFASLYSSSDAAAYRLSQLEKYSNEAEILDLLWYDASFADAKASDIRGMGVLRGIDIASFKGKDTFAMLHWGYNNISHGHLDNGTILYDNNGERWIEDLGSDDYNLADYFNVADRAYPNNRWGYFRTRAEGHNTMVIGNDTSVPDQIPDSSGKLIKSIDWGYGAYAAIDLTDCYINALSVKRGIILDTTSGRMTLVDEVALDSEHRGEDIYHIFHTKAMVTISDDGKTANLYKTASGQLKSIKMCILSDGNLSFEIRGDKPLHGQPDPGNQASNTTKMLYVKQADESDINTLQIVFLPDGDGKNKSNPPRLMPSIDEW